MASLSQHNNGLTLFKPLPSTVGLAFLKQQITFLKNELLNTRYALKQQTERAEGLSCDLEHLLSLTYIP